MYALPVIWHIKVDKENMEAADVFNTTKFLTMYKNFHPKSSTQRLYQPERMRIGLGESETTILSET